MSRKQLRVVFVRRRARLTIARLGHLILAGLAIALLQTALVSPDDAILSALQQGTNHYLLALQQIATLSSDLIQPKFTAIDPLKPKPDEELQPFLKKHPEVAQLLAIKAFLWGVIYHGEGTASNQAGVSPYRLLLGEHTFDDFKDHPRQIITVNPGTTREVSSDAAGACQFTSTIWDALHKEYPHVWYTDVPAFHPKNQDIGCLLLFAEVGGYQELVAGVSVNNTGEVDVNVNKFMAAVAISCPIWASFPCENGIGAYATQEYGNQQAKPIEDLWRSFRIALDAEQSLLSLRSIS
ncbi:MAG: glycoside hydrolase family 104 protein [Cyanobacteria bacterium CRU_2_1]|nr:glycoside hydrolase family 104 protein [Cyanobacteria bacterium CRU_2_1]